MNSDRSTLDFSHPKIKKALVGWWEALRENRGDRAELRRCKGIDEVLLTEAYHRLRRQLTATGFTPKSEDQLGAVTGLLAHVDENTEGSGIASRMAGGTSENEAPLSGLRFRKLLKTESREDLYRPLMRAVRLLDRQADVAALASDIFYWGTSVRKRWAREYYDRALEEV